MISNLYSMKKRIVRNRVLSILLAIAFVIVSFSYTCLAQDAPTCDIRLQFDDIGDTTAYLVCFVDCDPEKVDRGFYYNRDLVFVHWNDDEQMAEFILECSEINGINVLGESAVEVKSGQSLHLYEPLSIPHSKYFALYIPETQGYYLSDGIPIREDDRLIEFTTVDGTITITDITDEYEQKHITPFVYTTAVLMFIALMILGFTMLKPNLLGIIVLIIVNIVPSWFMTLLDHFMSAGGLYGMFAAPFLAFVYMAFSFPVYYLTFHKREKSSKFIPYALWSAGIETGAFLYIFIHIGRITDALW